MPNMPPTRTLLALAAVSLLALGAAAQSSAEFGRATGGSISGITKAPSQLSGSLSLSHATGGTGYGGTLGGEILEDRLWFFAGASFLPAIDVKAIAQPVDWTVVTASVTKPNDVALPESFLSLRSTSVLSDRMSLDFSFSRSTSSLPH